jgi:hypothetical protein
MSNRRRVGKGGIVFSYTKEEERKIKEKKSMKEILPLMASVILEMHENVKEDEDDGEPKLRASRGSAPKVSRDKILRLRRLMENLES